MVAIPSVAGASIGAAGAAALAATVAAGEARAGSALAATQDAARASDVDATTYLVHGDPGAAIVALARDLAVDLIVVGSRGLDASGRYVLGSVPEQVLFAAPCDVLVVRTG